MLYSTYIKKRSTKFNKYIEFLENKVNAHKVVKNLNVQVPKLYFVLDKIDNLYNIKLPQNCVIKFNNLACSNGIIIRKNNSFLKYKNIKEVVDYLKKFENIKPVGQKSIHNIKQKIMVEELLEPSDNSNILYDVKCFCFYGQVKYIHIINPKNRNISYMFNTKGLREFIYTKDELQRNKNIKKPKYFFDIIKKANIVASHLTKDYALRIDFYSTTKGPMFGEFTFNPNAGNGLSERGNKLLGQFLKNEPDKIQQQCDKIIVKNNN